MTWLAGMQATVSAPLAPPRSLLGGLIGGCAGAAIGALLLRVPVGPVLDCLAPAVAISAVLGRIQCFMAGCCFGMPTRLPWGVRYNLGTTAGRSLGPLPLHPVPLYEAFLIALLGVYLLRPAPTWRSIGTLLFGYGVIRFSTDFLRADTPLWLGPLSSSQVLTLTVFVPGGAAAIAFSSRYGAGGSSPPAPRQPG